MFFKGLVHDLTELTATLALAFCPVESNPQISDPDLTQVINFGKGQSIRYSENGIVVSCCCFTQP